MSDRLATAMIAAATAAIVAVAIAPAMARGGVETGPAFPAKLATTTVGDLPTCNTTLFGQMYFVTDALLPVLWTAVVGGGSVDVPVICNNPSWVAF